MAISEETIQAVLAAFPIREEWLRYGEGRMYEEGTGGKKSKPEVVGARLKEARERYGLTQEDVSKRTGLGHTTISNIEMGAQKATQKTVDAICQGLEVNESWLRGRDVLMSSGVGSRAAQLRNHLSLSVRNMGKAIGVSGQGLLNMESNTYFFSPEQIRKICDEYGASENWLLYGLGPIFQEGREVPAKTSAAEVNEKETAAAKEAKEAEGTRRRQYIKNLREKMGLTQAEFGILIGKAGTIISNLECGRIGVSDAVWDRVMKIDEKTIAVKRTGHGEMKKTSHSEMQKKAPPVKKKGHTITENIIVLRRFLGLSQTAFAASISRSPGFISNLEVGIGKASQETINRICNVYGVSEKWLRTGEEPMFVPGREQYPAETENIRIRMKEVRRKAGLQG